MSHIIELCVINLHIVNYHIYNTHRHQVPAPNLMATPLYVSMNEECRERFAYELFWHVNTSADWCLERSNNTAHVSFWIHIPITYTFHVNRKFTDQES